MITKARLREMREMREAGLVCQAWLEEGRITSDDYRDCERLE